jgi:hypothetical protein
MMPTFAAAGESNPIAMNLLARFLMPFGIALPHLAGEGTYRIFSGDLSVSDKGEILEWVAANRSAS